MIKSKKGGHDWPPFFFHNNNNYNNNEYTDRPTKAIDVHFQNIFLLRSFFISCFMSV